MTNSNTDRPPNLYQRYRRLSLGVKILIFMVLGVIVGIAFGVRATALQPLGDLFIRLLMMAVIPLVFFNLLAGITSLTDVGALGRLGGKIIVYYMLTTTVALTLGLVVMHVLQPGVGMQLAEQVDETFGEVPGVLDVFLGLIPVVFAIFLGVVTLLLPGKSREPLQNAYSILAELFRKLVGVIMYFGPIGIGALTASTVGEYGAVIFGPLAVFIGGVWGGQAIMVVFYMILLTLFTKYTPAEFLKKTGPLYATTAATCSSLASLAVSLDVAEERMQLPRSVYSFTLPLGAQLNKDGTAIMLAGVLLFTAQAAGVEFTIASQISILLVGLILSNGSGGIPGGGLVVALIFVQAFNLPLEIAAIVGGIYRLIDMGSTTINCMGDMVGTTIVAQSEQRREARAAA